MKNILIVDDIKENRYMIESLLKGDEFGIYEAGNGVEALALAHKNPPDLVISDILMPVMDGFTLCKEWRKDSVLKKIPFIFYTAAYTNPRDIKYALNLGADRVLIKPQEPEDFLSEIKQVLKDFETGNLKSSKEPEKNELEGLKEYNAILFRKLEDKLYQIELNERKLKRYSAELEQYAEKIKQQEQIIDQKQNTIERLTDFSSIPYIVFDLEFTIKKCNQMFSLFTGYQANELNNKKLSVLFRNDKLYKSFTDDLLINKLPEQIELAIITRDGSKKKAIWNFSSFIYQDGKRMISAVLFTSDINGTKTNKVRDKLINSLLEQEIRNRTIELENSREQLRGLSSHLQNVREEERKHVAREIHDELGHLLTALKLDMEGLTNSSLSVEMLTSKLFPLITLVDAAIDSVKAIATELRPAVLDNFGLIAALEWQIQQLRIRTNIECIYEFDVNDYPFTNEESTAVFRIFQEILTNISRHSKANKVWITFKKEDGYLVLKVKDNGIGFDVNDTPGINSFGLLGMSERALFIGGQLKIESIKDIGTTLILTINTNRGKG